MHITYCIDKFQRGLEVYRDPHYETAYSRLSDIQIEYLRKLASRTNAAMAELIDWIGAGISRPMANEQPMKKKTSGIYFKVSEEKRNLIEQKIALMGIQNMSGYIRKMCIDGCIINLQIPELTECGKLLRYISNNVNQIARRVNAGGGVYPDEVDEITAKLTETNGQFGNIWEQLSKIK